MQLQASAGDSLQNQCQDRPWEARRRCSLPRGPATSSALPKHTSGFHLLCSCALASTGVLRSGAQHPLCRAHI